MPPHLCTRYGREKGLTSTSKQMWQFVVDIPDTARAKKRMEVHNVTGMEQLARQGHVPQGAERWVQTAMPAPAEPRVCAVQALGHCSCDQLNNLRKSTLESALDGTREKQRAGCLAVHQARGGCPQAWGTRGNTSGTSGKQRGLINYRGLGPSSSASSQQAARGLDHSSVTSLVPVSKALRN